jgi:type I restriction enzyme R subunit
MRSYLKEIKSPYQAIVAFSGEREYGGLDRLSAILNDFNEQFGNIAWEDSDRVRRMITEEIPSKVAADRAYQNAMQNSDLQNAKIEHEKALERVMAAVLNDDTQLFSKFHDDPTFKRWLTDRIFQMTCDTDNDPQPAAAR